MDEEMEGRPAGGAQWKVGIGGGGRAGGVGAGVRSLGDREICAIALEVAGAAFGCDGRGLRAVGRGPAGIARARQIAMYLAHVQGELSCARIAACLERERTTVAYGCRKIEDLRDQSDWDRLIGRLEALMQLRCLAMRRSFDDVENKS